MTESVHEHTMTKETEHVQTDDKESVHEHTMTKEIEHVHTDEKDY